MASRRMDVEGERLRALGASPKVAPEARGEAPAKRREVPGRERKALEQARVNLTWLSRAIEDGKPLTEAIEEVYSMKIYGFAGDLRTLLKETK